MKKLITYLKALWRRVADSQSTDVSLDCRLTVGSPSEFGSKSLLKLVSIVALIFTLGVGNAWGTSTTSVTIHAESGTSHYAYIHSWSNGTQYDQVVLDDNISANLIGTTNNGKYYSDWRFYTTGSGSGSFSIDAANGARLKSVTFTYSTSNSGALYFGNTKLTSNTAQTVSGTSATFTTKNTNSATNGQVRLTAISVTYYPQTVVTLNANGGAANKTATFSYDETAYNSFTAVTRAGYTCTGYWTDASGGTKILNADGSRAANVSGWWSSNKWCKDAAAATLYAQWESAASCGTNPTAGSASLSGSISLSSFPVQTTGWTVGENCAWTDFGFVWSSSVSTPTIQANGTAATNCTKIQKATDGTSTSATHSITGSFSTGNSYYVRGYGKNGYASATYQYTSVLTITPRSVTFNLNGHGSSAPSTQYVNNGDKASDPSYSESVTGWTFGGWYKEAGCSNVWTFGTDVVSGGDKTLYAKWTAKTTTVSFNQNSGTGGQTGTLTATYGSAMPGAPVTCPTRTGYNFGGYYDGSGGTGTQYYTNAGASARSWDKDAATATLYAKWTAKSFTVTWMVNGESYSAGGSSSVDFGSQVATLPTAPTPPCGNKFMGWTTTNIGSVGLDKDDDAAAITALNLFTTAGSAPTISAEGNVTYYAVFADYAEK